MQLKVEVSAWGEDGVHIAHAVTSFDDAEKIGNQVGRWVRDFVRHVPMRKGGVRTQITIRAYYEERTPRAAAEEKPRRRRKKSADNGAAG